MHCTREAFRNTIAADFKKNERSSNNLCSIHVASCVEPLGLFLYPLSQMSPWFQWKSKASPPFPSKSKSSSRFPSNEIDFWIPDPRNCSTSIILFICCRHKNPCWCCTDPDSKVFEISSMCTSEGQKCNRCKSRAHLLKKNKHNFWMSCPYVISLV